MLAFDELLETLGYQDSPHYRDKSSELQPETAHLFRAAFDAKVQGIYVFETSPDGKTLPDRPVVYIAEANTEEEARQIHRQLWNLSYAPFVIIKLPSQIRIYTGFSFSQKDHNEGWLDTVNLDDLSRLLEVLSADAIDSGYIWESKLAKSIDANQRVDKKLLKNLKQLGKILKDSGLNDQIAHSLIGKYVYFNYLRDRKILSNAWLVEQGIEPDHVFTLQASVTSLKKLVDALEKRFNGRIFPIDFRTEKSQSLEDKHVSWVASIFSGNEIIDTAPKEIQQLHLPFKAYDFRYLPVETFSAIYEQFIDDRKEKGAVYTPEYLADYLLSEVEWAKPLKAGGKILDPACGSGVFLVLAYRRLIEKEIARSGRKLTPIELKNILEESVYGVERERDACYVTEFSLILTLLHYVEPPELEKLDFKFPALHNQQIFEADFFDIKGERSEISFWQQELHFDWIIGNPPWAGTRQLDPERDKFSLQWMSETDYPISEKRVAEAYSWLVTELLDDQGIAGLLLPATSLFNRNAKKYRQSFFKKNDVLRITNFANLRNTLFGKGKGDVLPAATFIYQPTKDELAKPNILHYGPFAINQVTKTKETPWTITINENEIRILSAYKAEIGDTSFWKIALWGTYLDKDAIKQIKHLFPRTIDDICNDYHWHFQEGSALRNKNKKTSEKIKYVPWLEQKKMFNSNAIKDSFYRFSVDPLVLEDIPEELRHIRVQGGEKGLNTTQAPHIILSPTWMHYIIFSEDDFVIPFRQRGIAAFDSSNEETTNYLKAFTVYLNSNLVAYYLFFQAHEWGIFRRARWVSKSEIGTIRVPDLKDTQAKLLAEFHDQIVKKEHQGILEIIHALNNFQQNEFELGQINKKNIKKTFSLSGLTNLQRKKLNFHLDDLRNRLRDEIDEMVFETFSIPKDLQIIVREFVKTRLALDKASTTSRAIRPPNKQELFAYANQLQNELNDFAMGTAGHTVKIEYSDELIECIVEISQDSKSIVPNMKSIRKSNLSKVTLLSQLSKNLREQVSQWVYIQRGLRLFDGPRIYIYKSPRLIDWTRTQAINDAGDIIGEIIAQSQNHETDYT